MKTNIDFSRLTPMEEVKDAYFDEKKCILELCNEAYAFLDNKDCCDAIIKSWWGDNWEDMIGVFLFEIVPNEEEDLKYSWVVVGDLPTAHIREIEIKDEIEAIGRYVDLMKEWIDAVYSKKDTSSLIKINVPPEKEWADALAGRINIICEFILEIPEPYEI